jgi:pyruvate ferredoxin oxidoreductase gamma subunit
VVFQIRVHGRGGQGVVTAAELLSVAAFSQGRHAQAFPSFGSERTGAPVVAFCRVDDAPIRLREPILDPDAVIVQDPTLLGLTDLVGGLPDGHAWIVPATALALTHVHRPVPNAALLGGFAALTGQLSLEAVEQAIAARFPSRVAAGNIEAARAAFHVVTDQIGASR